MSSSRAVAQTLDYPFLRGAARDGVKTALRFTLSEAGVHTAIVGTTKPERWRENAALLGDGRLPHAQREAIRARWKAVATRDWVGQI